MKEQNIKLKIVSEQFDVSEKLFSALTGEDALFDDMDDKSAKDAENTSDTIELFTDAIIRDDGDRIEVSYEETELTGMKGSTTAVSFKKSEPYLVTMLRGGAVRTALVFEEGKRNICTYETPYMPFELCISTKKVINEIEFAKGKLYLDYVVEIRGAKAERTKFTFEII